MTGTVVAGHARPPGRPGGSGEGRRPDPPERPPAHAAVLLLEDVGGADPEPAGGLPMFGHLCVLDEEPEPGVVVLEPADPVREDLVLEEPVPEDAVLEDPELAVVL